MQVFLPLSAYAVPNLSWMRVITSITFQNLYVTTFIILLIIMFYYFKNSLMVWDIAPYTLFRRLAFLSCNKCFTGANSFFLPCQYSIFELLTTKTLLLKWSFFPPSGKYNMYLLFVSFLMNGIIKGTSKEPSSNSDNCSCTLTIEIN